MLQLSVAYIGTNKASGMYASLALVLSELLATFGSLLTTELLIELSPGGVGVAHLIITVIVIQQALVDTCGATSAALPTSVFAK